MRAVTQRCPPRRGCRPPGSREVPFVIRTVFPLSVVPGTEMGEASIVWPSDGREGLHAPQQPCPVSQGLSLLRPHLAAARSLSLFAASPGPGLELRGSLATSTQVSPKLSETRCVIGPFEQNRTVERYLNPDWWFLPPFSRACLIYLCLGFFILTSELPLTTLCGCCEYAAP